MFSFVVWPDYAQDIAKIISVSDTTTVVQTAAALFDCPIEFVCSLEIKGALH